MPPFTGTAVNTTVSPGQIAVLSAVTVTEGTTFGFTVIVTDAVAVFGTAQPKLLVISTVITSPFTKDELE